MQTRTIKFTYEGANSKRAIRWAELRGITFMSNDDFPMPHFVATCRDLQKGEYRSFAIQKMLAAEPLTVKDFRKLIQPMSVMPTGHKAKNIAIVYVSDKDLDINSQTPVVRFFRGDDVPEVVNLHPVGWYIPTGSSDGQSYLQGEDYEKAEDETDEAEEDAALYEIVKQRISDGREFIDTTTDELRKKINAKIEAEKSVSFPGKKLVKINLEEFSKLTNNQQEQLEKDMKAYPENEVPWAAVSPFNKPKTISCNEMRDRLLAKVRNKSEEQLEEDIKNDPDSDVPADWLDKATPVKK